MEILNEIPKTFSSVLSFFSVDVICIVGIIVLCVAIGLAKGKNVILQILLSLYPATLVVIFFPYTDKLWFTSFFVNVLEIMPLAIFLISVVLFFLLFRTIVHARYQPHSFWRFLEVVIFSFLLVGLFFAILYRVVHIEDFYNFSTILDTIFKSSQSFFIWIIAPLMGIPLFMKT
jgi:hypothetical protein